MKKNKIFKNITSATAVGAMALSLAIGASAASESLNNGGATWSGGVNADGIVYSQLRDNATDGLRYKVTVWVTNDKGTRNEKTGTTDAVGSAGQVRTTIGATYSNPFVANKSGYNNFSVVR